MVEIHDFTQQDMKLENDLHEKSAIPAATQQKIEKRALSDLLIKKIFNFVFSYIYWLFACVYFFEYKDKLSNEYTKGIKIFLKSKAFWDFKMDVLIAVIGYFLLMSVLNLLLFRRLFCRSI